MSPPGAAAVNRGGPIRGSALRGMLRNGALLSRVPAPGTGDAEPQEVLTQSEVAALLRVERHHIKKLIESGLPYRRVGSMRRFLRRDVMNWLGEKNEAE
jgi:excisionase family DNA binding protein